MLASLYFATKEPWNTARKSFIAYNIVLDQSREKRSHSHDSNYRSWMQAIHALTNTRGYIIHIREEIPLFRFFIFRTSAFPDNTQLPRSSFWFSAWHTCVIWVCNAFPNRKKKNKKKLQNVLRILIFTPKTWTSRRLLAQKCVHATHERGGVAPLQFEEREKEREREIAW